MKFKDRRDILNFIKRCKMQNGEAFHHWRYRTSKKLSTKELKTIAKDYMINEPEIVEAVLSAPEGLDGRSTKWAMKRTGIKPKYVSDKNLWGHGRNWINDNKEK